VGQREQDFVVSLGQLEAGDAVMTDMPRIIMPRVIVSGCGGAA
jgi:hypothetical protein